jgi:hypothetical protein
VGFGRQQLCVLAVRKINKHAFRYIMQMASCFDKTAFLVAHDKTFYMKIYLRKILHPISTAYGYLLIF